MSEKNLDFSNVLAHELSPYPASMFDEDGGMKTPTTKASLKHRLEVINIVKTQVKGKTTHVGTMSNAVNGLLREGNVYQVFDRYFD